MGGFCAFFDSSRLSELAFLGWSCNCCVVNQPEQTIRDCREMSYDYLCAIFVNFGED
jgi:hypothetical protein